MKRMMERTRNKKLDVNEYTGLLECHFKNKKKTVIIYVVYIHTYKICEGLKR